MWPFERRHRDGYVTWSSGLDKRLMDIPPKRDAAHTHTHTPHCLVNVLGIQ